MNKLNKFLFWAKKYQGAAEGLAEAVEELGIDGSKEHAEQVRGSATIVDQWIDHIVELNKPNQETLAAMKESYKTENLTRYDNVESMMDDCISDIHMEPDMHKK